MRGPKIRLQKSRRHPLGKTVSFEQEASTVRVRACVCVYNCTHTHTHTHSYICPVIYTIYTLHNITYMYI